MSPLPPPRLNERPLHYRSISRISSIDHEDNHNDFLSNQNEVQPELYPREKARSTEIPSWQYSGQDYVKWGVVWYPPLLMAIYALGGIGIAIGHHFYYLSLHGTKAGGSAAQQWSIGIGTAISFIVVALLRSASSAAYGQFVWVLVKQRSYTLGTLDKLLALTTDATGFFGWDMLRCAKVAMLVALISWLTPLAGVAPPASLSVEPGLLVETRLTPMSLPNFNSPDFYQPLPAYILPSSKVQGIATQSALSMEILPLTPPAPNSSFSLQFYGPSIRCSPPPNSTYQLILDYYNLGMMGNVGLANSTQPIVSRQILEDRFRNETLFPTNSTFDPPGIMQYKMLIMSAFAPYAGSQGWLYGQLNPGAVDRFNNWAFSLPWEMNELGWDIDTYLHDDAVQKLFIQTSTEAYVCFMGNASYHVDYEYVNGLQKSVNYTTSDFHTTEVLRSSGGGGGGETLNNVADGPYIRRGHTGFELSYMSIWESFTSMVSGNITLGYFGSSNNLTLQDLSSRVLLTGLSACDEVVHHYWEPMPLTCEDEKEDPEVFFNRSLQEGGNFTNRLMEAPAWMCRNRTLPLAIEDLLGNITISMLSSSNLTSINSTQINVTYKTTRNVYRYDSRNLLLSYGIAICLTLLVVGVGAFAFLDNGVAHSSSFSAVIATTRNSLLDDISAGHSLGALPLDGAVKGMKLKFGELKSGKVRGDGAGKLAFGLEGEVEPIEKHGKYY